MNTPKISVIVPAYNEERYLGETLKALQAQDYPDFEVIVVDNASTDKTSEVGKSFSSVQMLYEPNHGTQFARECGRKAARGELIAFLDADCKPDPDWLSRGAAYFKDSRVVALGGPYTYFDAGLLTRTSLLFLQRITYIPMNLLLRLLYAGGILVAGNFFARSETLAHIGGLDTSFRFWGDDTDTARRLSKVGLIHFSWSFKMSTSARRLKRDGTLNTVLRYVYYFFRVVLSKYRPIQKTAP